MNKRQKEKPQASDPRQKRLRQRRIDEMFAAASDRPQITRNRDVRSSQRYSPVVVEVDQPPQSLNKRETLAGAALTRLTATSETARPKSSVDIQTHAVVDNDETRRASYSDSDVAKMTDDIEKMANLDQSVVPTTSEVDFRGCSFNELLDAENLENNDSRTCSALRPTDSHHSGGSNNEPPRPFPGTYADVWDQDHVRMPCSANSLYPNESDELLPRWSLIESALLNARNWKTSNDVQQAIVSYNRRQQSRWHFKAFHSFINKRLTETERTEFFRDTLPAMADLVLAMPRIVTQAIAFLRQGFNTELSLSQQQAACLLSSAFFCTFPNRNWTKANSEMANFPRINFSSLFNASSRTATEKLYCVMQYFRRVTKTTPTGCLTFQRCCLCDPPDWARSDKPIGRLHITHSGTIEDSGHQFAHADFANKFIGGGVIGHGCVQEAIRFIICPELIVSQLFTEVMADNEAVLITGSERFCDYTGYAESFHFTNEHHDSTPRDAWRRRKTTLLAVDARPFGGRKREQQFRKEGIDRELNKLFAGLSKCERPALASGNWGCGAFGGDKHLKALIQLLVTSECGKSLAYYTFGDLQLMNEFGDLYELIKSEGITVGKLYHILTGCAASNMNNLFSAVQQKLRKQPVEPTRINNNITDDPEPMDSQNSVADSFEGIDEEIDNCNLEQTTPVVQPSVFDHYNE